MVILVFIYSLQSAASYSHCLFGGQILNKKTPVPLSKYYLRRLTRLEPPYIIIMTLLFGALILVQNEDLKSLFPHYLASLFYLHRLFFDTWSPINPPTWTLEIEVQFYIIAPFLALLYFSIKRKWVRRWLIVILLVSKILVENTTTIFDSTFQTLPFVIQF